MQTKLSTYFVRRYAQMLHSALKIIQYECVVTPYWESTLWQENRNTTWAATLRTPYLAKIPNCYEILALGIALHEAENNAQ
jgi:hypothetical protein